MPDASSRLLSFSSGGEEVGHFHRVPGMFIRHAVGGLCSTVDTSNCR